MSSHANYKIPDHLLAEAKLGLRNGKSLAWASTTMRCGYRRAKALARIWNIEVEKHAVGRRKKGEPRILGEIDDEDQDRFENLERKRLMQCGKDFMRALRKEGNGEEHSSLDIAPSRNAPRLVLPETILARSSVMGDLSE